MLAKRIIPCLDIRDGRTVKGVFFENLRDAGDPVELARRYALEGADELVFLDITATKESRNPLVALVERVARVLNIPFTVGGGIGSIDVVRTLVAAGADKISLNSAAVRTPELITQIADEFGSQCVVVAIDTKTIEGRSKVFIEGGRRQTELDTFEWAQEVAERGAGEILLTSMDHDGAKEGFAVELVSAISSSLRIPVIASGGAGQPEHFLEVFRSGDADAALAASVFHFEEIRISDLKRYLATNGVPIRLEG